MKIVRYSNLFLFLNFIAFGLSSCDGSKSSIYKENINLKSLQGEEIDFNNFKWLNLAQIVLNRTVSWKMPENIKNDYRSIRLVQGKNDETQWN